MASGVGAAPRRSDTLAALVLLSRDDRRDHLAVERNRDDDRACARERRRVRMQGIFRIVVLLLGIGSIYTP